MHPCYDEVQQDTRNHPKSTVFGAPYSLMRSPVRFSSFFYVKPSPSPPHTLEGVWRHVNCLGPRPEERPLRTLSLRPASPPPLGGGGKEMAQRWTDFRRFNFFFSGGSAVSAGSTTRV